LLELLLDETPFGLIDRRRPHGDIEGDRVVGRSGIRGEKELGALDSTNSALAAADQTLKLCAFLPPMSNSSSPPRFTDKEGQPLAFIHAYVLLNGRAPAEADMERFFGVTPPTPHRMVVEVERRGLIRRLPRQARSIELVVATDELPPLRPNRSKPMWRGTSG
jgi:hypothetical protein